MPRVNEIAIKNVRCFQAEQRAKLGRITLLIGENSVGKSTFMGCYRAFATLSNLVDLDGDNPFDSGPFSMGTYDTIARTGAPCFTISGRYDDHKFTEAQFTFTRSENGKPLEEQVAFEFLGKEAQSIRICLSKGRDNTKEDMVVAFYGPDFEFQMNWSEISFVSISTWLSENIRRGFFPYNADRATFGKSRGSSVTLDEIVSFGKFINFFRSDMPLPEKPSFLVEAIDPNLSSRQRSYETPPTFLENIRDMNRINDTGSALGLWESIALNQVNSGGDTEVTVTTTAGSHNMTDVGYGVHSLLPIIRAISLADAPSIFLLQHPEVHVHPVAQAQLAQYMAEGPHDYMIESHSDHLLDRLRLCVMDGVLHPNELSILYFESNKEKTETRIFNIIVDAQGNVLDPPKSYRNFFLTETQRLLGFNRGRKG